MSEIIYKEESYEIVGICMDVHNELGHGLLEAVYKEAIEYEIAEREIPYQREKEFPIKYKTIYLQKKYYADFYVFYQIILEIKAKSELANEDIAQVMNYLKISGCKLGLLINFGKSKLEVKRIVL
jgi:GxxExxY protein